jgi:polyferredoxin
LNRQRVKKRRTLKSFFSNRWVYGVMLAILPSIFDRLLTLKVPAMDSKILQHVKKFFAIRFTFIIPIWILLSLGLVLIFIAVKYIVLQNKK